MTWFPTGDDNGRMRSHRLYVHETASGAAREICFLTPEYNGPSSYVFFYSHLTFQVS
jgi:hypothetical protein